MENRHISPITNSAERRYYRQNFNSKKPNFSSNLASIPLKLSTIPSTQNASLLLKSKSNHHLIRWTPFNPQKWWSQYASSRVSWSQPKRQWNQTLQSISNRTAPCPTRQREAARELSARIRRWKSEHRAQPWRRERKSRRTKKIGSRLPMHLRCNSLTNF